MDAQRLVAVHMQDPRTVHRPQIDLVGITALAATDYTKKPNVFRLKLGSGGEYLFHARDEVPPSVHHYCSLCFIKTTRLIFCYIFVKLWTVFIKVIQSVC